MKKVGKATKPLRYDPKQIPYDYAVEVINRFEGLDLVDRLLKVLWVEIDNIVQKVMTKMIQKKKKCKKAKWLTEEALQIVEKRREAKTREKGKDIQLLNAEFQRIARRERETLLSEQCKEIEGKNRMERLDRDLFNKIGNTKGTFHAKISTILDKNGKDLTETEKTERWQEYTEELCIKRP